MRDVFLLGIEGGIGAAIAGVFEKRGNKITAPRLADMDLAAPGSVVAYLGALKLEPDVIIHSAGINTPKPVEQITPEDMERTHAVNYGGFLRVVQHFIPGMKSRGRGHILAVSSIYGSISRAGRLPYATSKHALNGMIKTMAIEFAPYNIMANTISPGFVDTALTRKNNAPDVIKRLESMIPLGRMAAPEEIAEAAYFLCSPQNTYLTGQDITVDGAFSAGGFQR
ncbi:MAG: SDR family oxidoreductase [Elusimicrobiales bacterium]